VVPWLLVTFLSAKPPPSTLTVRDSVLCSSAGGSRPEALASRISHLLSFLVVGVASCCLYVVAGCGVEVASGREEVAGRENDSFDMEGNELKSLRWLGPGRRIEREVDASGGEGERALGAIGRGDEIN
jgi:hypothetical protein